MSPAGERPSAAQIKRRISQAKQSEKRSRESPREGELEEVLDCEHSEVEGATNELIAMLLAWDRFDDFMALLKNADFSSVARALKDRHDRLAAASVIEGEPVVTGPQQTSTAPEAVGETPPRDCIEAAASATPPEAAREAPNDNSVEEAAESIPMVPSQAITETPTHDRVAAPPEAEAVAPTPPEAAGPSLVAEAGPPASTEAVAETPTQDGGEAAAAAMSARAATDDDVAATAEAAPQVVAAQPSGGISAEDLMADWSLLKLNTRSRGRQWVTDGCPESLRSDEHHVITDSLLPFRAAASKASPSELQRFLEISAS
jgi:outer membrane biosynthesis protein TonB